MFRCVLLPLIRQLESIFSRFLADEYAPKPISSIIVNKIRRQVTEDLDLLLDETAFIRVGGTSMDM